MKILHVLHHSMPRTDGYSVRSQHIVKFQSALGLQPAVVTSPLHADHVDEDVEHRDGIPHYRTDASKAWFARPQLNKPLLRERLVVRQLQQRIETILEKNRFDLIHAHSPSLCGWPALQAARRHGIPVVYEVRAFWEDAAAEQGKFGDKSFRYKLSKWLETQIFRNADGVVAICQHLVDDIVSRGIDRSKVFHVPNGVDVDRFTPRTGDDELRAKYALDGCTTIGFIGSFFRFEGLTTLTKAMAIVARRRDHARLVMVGDGIEADSIRQLITELGLEDRVAFVGRVPHDEVLRYYSIMDVLVYPRNRHRLTELVTPLKPLEALAMEKAVVGSDVGGIVELLQLSGNGGMGMLFEAENVDDLADRLTALIDDTEMRGAIGRQGRTEVVRHRAWPVIAERYLEVYHQVLKERFPKGAKQAV